MLAVAKAFAGQFTATIHMDDADHDAARRLVPVLKRNAGRFLVNGFPTGVEVVDSMVPAPDAASTNFGATSVRTLSIRRFLRLASIRIRFSTCFRLIYATRQTVSNHPACIRNNFYCLTRGLNVKKKREAQ